MKKVRIQDLAAGLINGVEVQLPKSTEVYKETYFEWAASSLVVKVNTTDISGGILRSWHHTPVFREIETHIDIEMFYFISGVALMLFIDIKEGSLDMESAQLVRIQPGSQITISAGKGHFVPVAENSEPVYAIVIAPKMDAPRMCLPLPIEGTIV